MKARPAARAGKREGPRSLPPAAEPWGIVEADLIASAPEGAPWPPPEGAEIAFAGRSNVGKSSLMNALCERRGLVRVSSTPGCTRALQFFRARSRDGANLVLVDLPGYGYAARARTERAGWARLIERYLVERGELSAVVLLVDARRGLEDDDLALPTFLRARPGPTRIVVVATKIDKLPRSSRAALLARLALPGGGRPLGVSAETREGIPELWRVLRAAAGVGARAEPTSEES